MSVAAAVVGLALMLVSCGGAGDRVAVPGVPRPTSTTTTDVFTPIEPTLNTSDVPATTALDPTTTAPATTSTTSTTSTTLPIELDVTPVLDDTTNAQPPPVITVPIASIPVDEPADPSFGATAAAFERLARNNSAASISVARGGELVYSNAAGTTIDGAAATADSPMVVASISKLMVAVGIARLDEAGLIDIAEPVPLDDVGLTPNAAWNTVTVRDLLDHRSGLAKARTSWFTGQGTCRNYVPFLLASAPEAHRGEWVYSNGNYCLLGLLIEQRTQLALDEGIQQLVFDPVDIDGIHLTDGGLLPGDVAYAPGVERLSRLGGAGTLVVSTDDLATVIGRLTPADRAVLQPPSVFLDQYGIGHTGTVDGAKSCVWLLDGGATVVAATIAGNSLRTGGTVCDLVVPAVASDLGINQGEPERWP